MDTNILVSSRLTFGNPYYVVQLARAGHFDLCLSVQILSEFSSVMMRRFRWSEQRINSVVEELRRIATLIDPPSVAHGVTGHPPDDRILDCVAAAEADFLVTGDRRHLLPLRTFGNARIVTAAEFLEALEASDS